VSPRPHGAFESFDSDGVQFIRPSGLNKTAAANSAKNTLFEDAFLAFDQNTEDPRWDYTTGNPAINDNDNLSRGGQDTMIINPRIIFHGPVDNNNFLRGITAKLDNLHVEGGLYYIPESYRNQLGKERNAIVVENNSDSNYVANFTSLARGNPNQHPRGDIVFRDGIASGEIINSVADTIINTGINSGNQTINEYQASLGPNQPPTADFDIQDIKGEGSYNFFAYDSDDADGYIIRYDWSFSDGSTDRLPYASHHFDNPGTYDVTLTVTDERGAVDSVTKSVTVNQVVNPTPPQVTISDCANIKPGDPAASGYAPPIVPDTNILALDAKCDSDNVYITLGTGDNSELNFPYGYYYDGSSWQNLIYNFANQPVDSWVRDQLKSTIPLSNLTSPGYVLGYMCRWNGNSYECPNNWMLQRINY
jgi:PKD repeat protein